MYSQTCLTCADECTDCFGQMKTQCIECALGYFLYDTTCYLVCPPLKPYHDMTTMVCVDACPGGLMVTEDQLTCTPACEPTYYENGSACVRECPVGFYKGTSECLPCDPACALCTDPTRNQCSRCNPNYFLDETTCDADLCFVHPTYKRSQYYWRCMDQCISGMYEILTQALCVSKCPDDTFRMDGICYYDCPDGYYGDTFSSQCKGCPIECALCFGGTPSKCSQCNPGYFLELTTCTFYCSSQYYKNLDTFECIPDCPPDYFKDDDGSGTKVCVSECPALKFMHYVDFRCYSICPDGYYGDNLTNGCEECSIECAVCEGSTNLDCLECSEGFVPNQGACMGECPIGYFS